MEIRCENCEFLGAAAEVRPTDGGVGLVCRGCGFVNIIAPGAPSDGDEEQDELGRDGVAARAKRDKQKVNDAVVRLLPEVGEGRRCAKCLSLVAEDAHHCGACGLALDRAADYGPGEAPWERPPAGKEKEAAEADKLWEEAVAGAAEGFPNYADYCVEHDLVDLGIRRLQGYLVDARDDEAAKEALGRLAISLEAAIFVARSRAQAEGEQFQTTIKQARTRLLLGALIFWTVILLLFSWLFWDKF